MVKSVFHRLHVEPLSKQVWIEGYGRCWADASQGRAFNRLARAYADSKAVFADSMAPRTDTNSLAALAIERPGPLAPRTYKRNCQRAARRGTKAPSARAPI
jgi:hypothetical protein